MLLAGLQAGRRLCRSALALQHQHQQLLPLIQPRSAAIVLRCKHTNNTNKMASNTAADAMHQPHHHQQHVQEQSVEDRMPKHPQTWQEVTDLISTGRVEYLGRTVQDLATYSVWRDRMLLTHHTVGDVVLNAVFKYPLVLDNGKLRAQLPESPGKRIIFRLNDFPYSLEAGIEHHVIWAESGLVTEEVIKEVIARERQGYETLYWINPPHLQSVRAISHAHVLSRKRAS
eukprot:m.97223 g.97223  ORF g.97223 m.97223 type:complete len:229 (-) comp15518_c0_seq2:546-1232(-)